jgi:hypothetical protein
VKDPLNITFSLDRGDNRGIYYEETHRSIIYPRQHETLADLMKTIIHETIHHCIGQLDETLDEEQEEQAIFWMQWIDSELVFSEYDI